MRELLEWCARPVVESAPPSGIDWERALPQARAHGVAPLLAHHLRAAGVAPPAALTREVARETARNLLLTGALRELALRFEAAGIGMLPYKGPLLAVWLYGDVGLRPSCDLDLLVRRRDLARAAAELRAAGFRTAGARRAVALSHAATFRRGGVVVELHWRVASPGFTRLPDPFAMRAARPRQELAGLLLPRMTAEEALLALSVHGAKHGWSRLGWIADLRALLARGVDRGAALAVARRCGAARAVELGLHLAEGGGARPAVARLAERVRALAFAPPAPAGRLTTLAWHLRVLEDPLDRLRYLTMRLQRAWASKPSPARA